MESCQPLLSSDVDGVEVERAEELYTFTPVHKRNSSPAQLSSGRPTFTSFVAVVLTSSTIASHSLRWIGLLLNLLLFILLSSRLFESRTPSAASDVAPSDETSLASLAASFSSAVWSYRLCNPMSPTFPHVHVRVQDGSASPALLSLRVFAIHWDESAQEWRLLSHMQALEGEQMEARKVHAESADGIMAALVANGAMQCAELDVDGHVVGGQYRVAYSMDKWTMTVRCTFARRPSPQQQPSIRLRLSHPWFIDPLNSTEVALLQSGNGTIVTHNGSLIADICRRSDRPVKIAHCSMSNDGDAYRYQMLHFIHHHAYLGIERFYVMDETGRLQSVLQPYIDSGLVDYQYFFPISPAIVKFNYLWAQQLMMETCRYNARASSEWITNLDVDEWIRIPASSWLQPAAALPLSVHRNEYHFPHLYPTLITMNERQRHGQGPAMRCGTEMDYVKPAARASLGAVRNLTQPHCLSLTDGGAPSLSALGLFLDVVTDPAARSFLASWNDTSSWAPACAPGGCKDRWLDDYLSAVVTLSWLIYDQPSNNTASPALNASLSPPLPLLFPNGYVPLQLNKTRVNRYKIFLRPSMPAPWMVHGFGWHDQMVTWLERPMAEIHFQHFWRAATAGRDHHEVVDGTELLVEHKDGYQLLLHDVYGVNESYWKERQQ